ncbi:MAG: hypothetical protein C4526_05470 [Nitrospiraceae bacterium]|nr:MAG: hypothetical protein C4526_05470 [Nitrospiraceae bacterium]
MNAAASVKKQYAVNGLKPKAKNLAEAIILQSLEDLWNPEGRSASRKFFRGNGFKICAEVAGLDTLEQFRVLHLIGGRSNGRNTRIH